MVTHRRVRLLNRKGEEEEFMAETVAKLLIGAAIIIAFIFIGYELYQLFNHGEEDWRSKRNLQLLSDRIDYTIKQGATMPDSSVVLSLPVNVVIAGFDSLVTDKITLVQGDGSAGSNTYDFVRPKDLCKGGQTCLCVMRVAVQIQGLQSVFAISGGAQIQFNPSVLDCKVINAKYLVSNVPKFEVHTTGVNQVLNIPAHSSSFTNTYDIFLTPFIPGAGDTATHDVHILFQDNTVFVKI